MKKISIIVAIALSAAAFPAAAWTAKQDADMARVEEYFSSVGSMTADFRQASSSGDKSSGKLYLLKPGRLKMVYDMPANMEIIANGKNFIYWDKDLQQTTYLDIGQTAAGVILKDRLSFGDPGLKVTDVRTDGGLIEITVTQADDPIAGAITLGFSLDPMRLVKWRTTDAQGITTIVALQNQKVNVPVDKRLIYYVNPRAQSQRRP